MAAPSPPPATLLRAARAAHPERALAVLAHRHDPRTVLHTLASLQDGQYAVAQARSLGLGPHATRWLITSGRAEAVARGVGRFVGAPGAADPAVTAALRCWPTATVGYGSAAHQHGLQPAPPPRPELIVPHASHRAPAGIRLHQTRELAPADRFWVGAVAYTSVARTVCDLADGADPTGTLTRLDDAVAAGASRRWLHARATALADGRNGVALVRDATGPGSAAAFRSWLERTAATVYRAAHLPEPAWNHRVSDRRGLIGIVDAIWLPYGVISELEGLRFHTSPRARQRDAARFNRLSAARYAVRRFSYRDVVERPVEVAVTVAEALRAAGAEIDLAAIPRRIAVAAPVLRRR